MSNVSLKEIIDRHRLNIMKTPGVVSVGAGLSPTIKGKRCILVYILEGTVDVSLPNQIEGYDVEIVKTSKGFRAL